MGEAEFGGCLRYHRLRHRAALLSSSQGATRRHGSRDRCGAAGIRCRALAPADTCRARSISAGDGRQTRARASDYSAIWPRESGVVHAFAKRSEPDTPETLRFYADLADDYPFEEPFTPSAASLAGGGVGLLVREPVGVVGAIIPWNGPLGADPVKVAPALLAGCTVIVKVSPEAPGAGLSDGGDCRRARASRPVC